jgi:hypothetical protein
LHLGRVVTIKQFARLYGAAFMKSASVETAENGLMTSETLRSSYWIQTFFQIGCFSHRKPQTDLLQKSLLTQHMDVRNVCDDADFPPYKNSGVSSLLVKSQEVPEFSQTSMKLLSKYHHNISSASHKNELASTADVNKQRKINKRDCNTKLLARLKEAHIGKGRQ